jgi:hypothetical protein
MNEQIFPSWWGQEGGAPIQCRSAREVREGWVRHFGHYDAARGIWVAREPLDHGDDPGTGGSAAAVPKAARLPGLARKSRAALVAIAAAEGARHKRRASRTGIIAAIRAGREEG